MYIITKLANCTAQLCKPGFKKKNAISNHADLVWGIVHISTEQTVAELLFLILGMGNNYNLQTPLMRF